MVRVRFLQKTEGSLRTRCAVFPRRALQSVVSTSGLARRFKGRGHREQPKISEEGIWPSRVIAKASTLTRTMKLSTQDRSKAATNKAVDGREGVSVGLLEIAEPTTQEWIERRNDVLDRVTPVTRGLGPDFIP